MNIMQVINDAIHGPIVLTPLQFQIINTREFHRLKDLRQLGEFSSIHDWVIKECIQPNSWYLIIITMIINNTWQAEHIMFILVQITQDLNTQLGKWNH